MLSASRFLSAYLIKAFISVETLFVKARRKIALLFFRAFIPRDGLTSFKGWSGSCEYGVGKLMKMRLG